MELNEVAISARFPQGLLSQHLRVRSTCSIQFEFEFRRCIDASLARPDPCFNFLRDLQKNDPTELQSVCRCSHYCLQNVGGCFVCNSVQMFAEIVPQSSKINHDSPGILLDQLHEIEPSSCIRGSTASSASTQTPNCTGIARKF